MGKATNRAMNRTNKYRLVVNIYNYLSQLSILVQVN